MLTVFFFMVIAYLYLYAEGDKLSAELNHEREMKLVDAMLASMEAHHINDDTKSGEDTQNRND
jgi:hypothetical protein